MKGVGVLWLVLALSACAPRDETQAAEQIAPIVAPIGCRAEAARDWSAVGSQYYVIEARAEGRDCTSARATIRIESVAGEVLFERGYDVAQLAQALDPNGGQAGLRYDIEAWTQNSADPATADTLPAWPAGAESPPGFTPAVARSQYESARGMQGPLFCFVDAADSLACVALAGDRALYLGSLSTAEQP